ncbi:MAG: hypothetical protein RL758_253 [Pseudomonadota bacterium]|jgi:hypothetical protein
MNEINGSGVLTGLIEHLGARAGPQAAPSQPASPLDTQVGGSHYKNLAIQPVEFCQRNGLGFCESSAIKYLVRHRSKDGRKDLEKARHFIDLLIAMEYGEK